MIYIYQLILGLLNGTSVIPDWPVMRRKKEERDNAKPPLGCPGVCSGNVASRRGQNLNLPFPCLSCISASQPCQVERDWEGPVVSHSLEDAVKGCSWVPQH